jgi:DNA-binding XRE family transcriptional regulator
MTEKRTLKEWRQAAGLTQMALAYQAGVGLSTIADCESGRRYPRIDNAEKIANALGLSIGDIEWNVRK